MNFAEITEEIKAQAKKLGFTLAGVCPAATPPSMAQFDNWLEAGHAGQMHYLADRRQAYDHPNSVLEGATSVVMLAIDYRTAQPNGPAAGQGRVSRYAWGSADYHDLIRAKLNTLADFLTQLVPDAKARGVVDTAPLMERDFAQLAGLGWIGKNTLLLNKERGSWFFLAALLTDITLEFDIPHQQDHCGTCRACLDACPTDAFPEPFVLDASRCISYLTIELKEKVPVELRGAMGDWAFGCDVCQDVCPWNRGSPISREPVFEPLPENNPLDLIGLFDLDEEGFRQRFRNTPLWRPKRRGILRNAAIVLGNQADSHSLSVLAKGLNDIEPLVRGACAWALGQFEKSNFARTTLAKRQTTETDSDVLAEIELALKSVVCIDETTLGERES